MESGKHKFWFIILILDLIFLNSAIVFLFLKPQSISKNTVTNNCDQDCKQNIDSKLNELSSKLEQLKLSPIATTTPIIEKESIAKSISQIKPKAKTKSTFYVNIPGSGSLLSYNWADIPTTEFYLDTNDFPGLVNIYFESNMKLFNGNGTAFIRLYDSTHSVGVQGSEVQTNSQNNTVVTSGQVSFFAGKNLIKVQAKSLTADTTIFNSGRLKITVEN